VLTNAGIPTDRFDLSRWKTEFDPREFCVQYRETDYNFICRLMEEVGARWYFEQTKDAHKFVVADAADSYTDIEGESAELPYRPPTALNVSEGLEHIYRLRISQCVRSGAVVLNDYSFENPKLNLQSNSDCGRDKSLEYFDCPGEYEKQGLGGSLAKIRAEEFESARIHGTAQGNSPRLAVGRKFTLTEHPSAPTNAEYLITTITHQGRQSTTRTSTGTDAERFLDGTANRARTQWLFHGGQVANDLFSAGVASGANPLDALSVPNLLDDPAGLAPVDGDAPVYDCSFEFIPSSVTYRPPRITPWPKMRGAQTAIVVGPSGEEIHTDKYGRVRVQFKWDREGNENGEPKLYGADSSCWIRVSQGMAGGQYGMMFLPRVGQEVVVDFLEGDPDRPIITGRVYNADQMPPYELPKEKTKSVIKTNTSKGGGGTNEVRFEDLKGKEQILIYAQKDLHLRTNNDRVENVGHEHHLTVDKGKYELVKKNKHVEVLGDLNEKLGGDLSLEVEGMSSVKISGTHSTKVGSDVVDQFESNHKHNVGATYALKAMSAKIEASTGIELKCGGSSIILTPAAIFIVGGPLVNINSGSGPPVGPVTASATSPAAPDSPVDADSVEPGKDTSYTGDVQTAVAETAATAAGHEFEPTEVAEQATSWIKIRLVNEAGEPVPSERYKITCPDGTVKEGALDANGEATVHGVQPGNCDITFPNLDRTAWRRKST